MKDVAFEVRWQLRDEARAAAGAVACGEAAERLVRRLIAADDAALAMWCGVSTADAIVILGHEQTLPWVDGILYLSRDARAPRLFLPTLHDPTVPLDLFERALIRESPFPPPLAVFDTRVVSLADAREVSRTTLLSWPGSL